MTREELRAEIWSADTFVDFDHSLHNAIARVRDVLGDSAETPRYIETLPRRGYKFIAPVEGVPTVEARQIPPENGHPPVDPVVATVRSKRRAGLVFAVGLLCAIVGGWVTWRHFSVKWAGAPIRSLAVLPMANLSGDPAQDFFADGMTEELTTELSRIHAVKVISRTSVMEYKGTKKHLPQIARELGVDGIVEGSVSGGRPGAHHGAVARRAE